MVGLRRGFAALCILLAGSAWAADPAPLKIAVQFSIDDFDTGYSSLSYLKQLPVSTLKIDQTFVRDMLDDPDALTIVDGVVAEGVETVAYGKLLLRLGCELAQWLGSWTAPQEWKTVLR